MFCVYGVFFKLPQEGEVASSIQSVHGLSRAGTVSSPQKLYNVSNFTLH